MRHTLLLVCAISLLSLPGCAKRPDMQRDVEAHHAYIDQAFQKALRAEDPWERQLWETEYQRRARALEDYMAAEEARGLANRELWRQLGSAVTEAGLLIMQNAQADALGN